MKTFFICDVSSVLGIRHLRNFDNHIVKTRKKIKDSCNNSTKEALLALESNYLDDIVNPEVCCYLHICISDKAQYHVSSLLKMHQFDNLSAPRNCIQICTEIYSVPFEFVFCYIANKVEWVELFLLGLEFCGTYSMDPDDMRGFRSGRHPIVLAATIRRCAQMLCDNQRSANGASKALRVANLLEDGSASPRESMFFIILTGPHKKGCYGARGFKFNQEIILSQHAAKIAGQDVVFPDLCNWKYKIAIEYDSSMFHESEQQGQRDKRRREALEYDGWKTFTILNSYFNNQAALDAICRQILKACGKRYDFHINNFSAIQHQTLASMNHPFCFERNEMWN